MGLLGTTTQESYYNISQSFSGNGTAKVFQLLTTSFDPLPTNENQFNVFINGRQISSSNYTYSSPNLTFTNTNVDDEVQESDGAPKNGLSVVVKQIDTTESYGNYQYVKMRDIINNFMVAYVGENKIISKASRSLVGFHAQRGIQEFSYDVLRSEKSQEIELPPSLQMILPHDYVNYVKLSWTENETGIEHTLYPATKTGNPKALLQDADYNYIFDQSTGKLLTAENSDTWTKYSTNTTDDATRDRRTQEELHDVYIGQRYGIDPQFAQNNGSFFVDNTRGKIHFSSNLSGKIIVLRYISDSLGTDDEMQVHKFAEEALYKHIAYSILSTSANMVPGIAAQFKKERFAAMRNAKLRLSNLKSEEITQVMRGKSKHIKH